MEWTNDDKSNLHQTISIIKQVEKTHTNLSFPLIFTKLCDFADLGVMLLTFRGKGKGAILQTLAKPPMQHRTAIKVGAITYRGLKKIAERLDHSSVTVINPDISTLYTEYLRDVAVNVFSQLIYDHEIPEMHTQQYDLQIKNSYISFLCGTQPRMYQSLSQLPTFESMYKDRFIRIAMLHPLGTPSYKKFYPTIQNIHWENLSWDYMEFKPELFRLKEYKRLEDIICWHTSESRGKDYTERLVRASARLNNRLFVTESDIKFLTLMIPYISFEKWTSKRYRGVSEPLTFNADAYTLLLTIIEKGIVSRTELRAQFQVTNATIINNIKPLMGKRIITGKFGADKYCLHKQFAQTYIQPIYTFIQEAAGISLEKEELTRWMQKSQ